MCEFLATQRARITPVQAGLPVYRGVRRVVGPNRDEVAMPAGVSSEYHARPERGNLRGVSDSVLDALARALQLDQAEHASFRFGQAAAASPGQLLLDVPAGMSVPGNGASWTA